MSTDPNIYLRHQDGMFIEDKAAIVSAGKVDANRLVSLNDNGQLDDSIVGRAEKSLGPASAGVVPKTRADGTIDPSFLPGSLGSDVTVGVSAEDLAAGAWVSFDEPSNSWYNASANGRPADGFVLTGFSAKTQEVSIYTSGRNTAVVGQTVGNVYLQVTAGQGGSAPATGRGVLSQRLGRAVSPTCVIFQRGEPVRLLGR
jgi:hypothetical protein